MDDIIRPIGEPVSEYLPNIGVRLTHIKYGDMRYFSVKYLCSYLGINDYRSKVKSLRKKWFSEKHMFKVLYPGEKGKRTVWCIDQHGLTRWLMIMKTKKLPPDTQALVDQIQTKMLEEINRQFDPLDIIKRVLGATEQKPEDESEDNS